MKIKNQQLIEKNTKMVTLTRGGQAFELLLTALPPGYDELMEERGLHDVPRPPMRYEKRGEVYIRNKAGEPVLKPDYDDPEYAAKFRRYMRNRSVLAVVTALRNSEVSFETAPPTTNSREAWSEYADTLSKEVLHPDTGFTEEELANLLDTIKSLSCRLDVEGATDRFLDRQ